MRNHPKYVQSSSIFRCLWRCLHVMSMYKSLCYIKTYHRTSFQQELPWWSTSDNRSPMNSEPGPSFLSRDKSGPTIKLIIFLKSQQGSNQRMSPFSQDVYSHQKGFLCLGGLFSTSVPVVIHGNCAVVLWFWSSSFTLGTNKTSLVLWRMSQRGNVNKDKAQ